MSFEAGNDSRDDLPAKPDGKKWNAATTYDPSYCEKLLELCAQGHSFAVCSREMDVSFKAMTDWRKGFPEWAAAYEQGIQLQKAWWEQLVRENSVYYDVKDGPKRVVKDSLILHRLRCYFDVKEGSTTINPDGSVTTNDERLTELTKKYLEEKL